jgi:hypothetical protein
MEDEARNAAEEVSCCGAFQTNILYRDRVMDVAQHVFRDTQDVIVRSVH